MTRFDRYMLSQLVLLFGFYGLILVLLFWINRAVKLFDSLIANGETVLVFLELSALIVPSVMVIVLPIAALAASVSLTNRLRSESELVVLETSGFSPYRLGVPVLFFGLFVAGFMLLLTHILVPLSKEQLSFREGKIAENITSRFLNAGKFSFPGEGVSLYIRDISAEGEILDIYLSDERDDQVSYTYSAKKSLIVRTKQGPRLMMFEGLIQALDHRTSRLSVTRFDDFSYDISTLLGQTASSKRHISEIHSGELLSPSAALQASLDRSAEALRTEVHFRNAQAIYGAVTAMLGFSMLIIAGFSRFGSWRQVIFALIIGAVLQSLDNVFFDLARREDGMGLLVYTASLIGVAVNLLLLFFASNPEHLRGLKRRGLLRQASAKEARP